VDLDKNDIVKVCFQTFFKNLLFHLCLLFFQKYKMPASILLIHDKMYRNGGVLDFGKLLKEWAGQYPPKEVGDFSAGDSKTCLKDLTLRLGFPYVYIHAGKCEHIVVFNTIG
jgi:hypothetical protein